MRLKRGKKNFIIMISVILAVILLLILGLKLYAKNQINLSIDEKTYYVHQNTSFSIPQATASDQSDEEIDIEIIIYKDGKKVDSIDTNHVGDVYKVYYKAYKGILSIKKYITVKVIANENLLKYDISGISNEWTNQDVTLTFVPKDDNIKEYCFDGKCTSSKEVKVAKNGSYNTYIVDDYGNKSEEKTYKVSNIDKTIPKITKVNEYTKNNKIYLGVTATDDMSGVKEYSFDDGKTYSEESTIRVTKDTTVKVIVKDAAGNESEVFTYNYVVATANIQNDNKTTIETVDTTAPTFTLTKSPDSEWSNSNVTITVNATDDMSGVKTYSFDNGSTWQTSNTKEYTASADIKVKVKDNAGNTSASKEESVKIDKTAPVINNVTNEETYTEAVTFAVVEDNLDTAILKKDGTEIAYVTTVNENGAYSIVVTDKAGNSASIIFIIEASEGIIEGIADDWELVANETGGYTLLAFTGDLEDCENVEVDNNYFNDDFELSIFFENFLDEGLISEMVNINAYTVNIPNIVDNKTITEIGPSLFAAIDFTTEEPSFIETYFRIKEVKIPEGIVKINGLEGDTTSGAFMYNVHLATVTMPSTLKDIGPLAFYNNQLTTVTFEENSQLTTIGDGAFGENQLTTVTIPSSVKYLSGFGGNNLTTITIPDSVTTIGDWAFGYNQLTTVTIPDSVTTIGDGAFEHNQLTTVTIPSSVKYLSGFGGNNLTTITIPDSVTTIGDDAFGYNQLTTVTIPSSVKYLSGFGGNNLTTITIPDSVTTIGGWAFESNQLTTVTIPDSVTTIGDWAFGYNQLTTVTIPSSVKYLSGFGGNNLTTITIPDSVITIGERAFEYNQLTTVTIPDLVTTIGDDAFEHNQLTTVTIPSSVKYLSGFGGNNLTTITIPDSVTTIGYGAFGSNQLTTVTIPDSVTTIGDRAFGSNQLTTVTFEENSQLTTIGDDAFEYNQLTTVTFEENSQLTTIGDEAFRFNHLTTVTIPSSVKYLSGFRGNNLTTITIPDSVTTIGDWAFGYNQLTTVTIPDSVTTIGDGAFEVNQLTTVTIPSSVKYLSGFGRNNLTTITIPDSVTTIGDDAFYYNPLTTITIPDSVTTIGDRAFRIMQLTTVTFEENSQLTTIGDEAFRFNQLTTVTIPDSVTTIGDGAFESNYLTTVTIPSSVKYLSGFGGNNLTTITIPDSVITIGDGAFESNQLTTVTIPDSVTTIGDGAFGYNQLTTVTIPDSVTTIGDDAFEYNQLTTVTIPSSVKYLSGFGGNNLTTITIPDSVTTIGDRAFVYNQLTTVTIPALVTTIGYESFYNNPNLTTIIVKRADSTGMTLNYNWNGTATIVWDPS